MAAARGTGRAHARRPTEAAAVEEPALAFTNMSGNEPWAPSTNHDQPCAFCGTARPIFAHRLNPEHVEFRAYGKGWTLPTFWAACARCEALVARHDEDALLHLMAHGEDDDTLRRASLEAFRAADLGSEPLAEGPPDTLRP